MIIDRMNTFEMNILKGYTFETVVKNNLNILRYDNKIVYSKNKDDYFYKNKTKKEKIVLHHTVGNIYSDFMTLTKPEHVSVSYLISPNGNVIELFNPEYWSYHLGRRALGGNTLQSKKSIGIEISNYGYLTKLGNNLYTVYNDIYCTLDDIDQYDVCDFRGQKYWAKFTVGQYYALKKLLEILTEKFDIPYEFMPVKERHEYTKNVINFKGITSHVNYRKDKWDLAPVFDWSKIEW